MEKKRHLGRLNPDEEYFRPFAPPGPPGIPDNSANTEPSD